MKKNIENKTCVRTFSFFIFINLILFGSLKLLGNILPEKLPYFYYSLPEVVAVIVFAVLGIALGMLFNVRLIKKNEYTSEDSTLVISSIIECLILLSFSAYLLINLKAEQVDQETLHDILKSEIVQKQNNPTFFTRKLQKNLYDSNKDINFRCYMVFFMFSFFIGIIIILFATFCKIHHELYSS